MRGCVLAVVWVADCPTQLASSLFGRSQPATLRPARRLQAGYIVQGKLAASKVAVVGATAGLALYNYFCAKK